MAGAPLTRGAPCPLATTLPPSHPWESPAATHTSHTSHTHSARCVLSHPAETRPVLEKELWALWQAHLWDNIPSVRRNTSIAIGNALRSYGQEALDRIAPVVR